MANAGTVTVDFAAETAKFTAELKQVNSRLKGMETGFSSLASVAKLSLGFLSVGVVTGFAKSVFEAADAVGDMSARLGVSASELSKLKFIADQSDVSFESLSVGIKTFEKNVSNSTKVFNELGLSATQLKNLSLNEQFEILAQAFKDITNPADQTRIAMELFGKAGVDLVPLLNQGADGMRRLGDEAERTGAVISDETAKAIGEADNAIKSMKSSVSGAATTLLSELAPAIKAVADGIRTLAGGATEIEKLTTKLNFLKDQRNSIIPVVLNFGYDDGLGFVSGPGALDKRIAEIQAKIDQLKAKPAQKLNIPIGAVALDQSILQEVQLTSRPSDNAIGLSGGAAAAARAQAEIEEIIRESQERQEFESLNRRFDAIAEFGAANKDIFGEIDTAWKDTLQQQEQDLLNSLAYQVKLEQQAAAEKQAIQRSLVGSATTAFAAVANSELVSAKKRAGINKALALAQAIQNTYTGATLQLSSGDPYTAIFRAGAVIAFGLLQVAAIAKTDYGSASGSGGAPSSLGGSANPIYTTSSGTEQDQGASTKTAVQLTINGNIFSSTETAQWLIDTLQEAVSDRDVVFISGSSRQAQELMPV